MASGTISLTSSTSKLAGRVTWSSTPNTAENKSSVTMKFQIRRTDSYTTTGTWQVRYRVERSDGTELIGRNVQEAYKSVSSSWVTLYTLSFSATHNSSGKRTLVIWPEIVAPSETNLAGEYVTTSGGKSFTLDTIARAASITSASNFNDEGKPTMKYSNPAGSAATVQVGVFWDSSTALIPYTTVTGTSGTKEFTLTTDQKNAIYSKLANATSATVYYYIKTVISGTTYTSKLAKTVSITNAAPTLSPTAVEDENPETDGGDAAGNIAATGSNTRWLKGISDVRYAFNASGKKGASIKSYSVVCGSKKGSSASGVLFNVDSGTIKFTVTDSRGNTATQTLTRTLVNYVKPTCSLTAKINLSGESSANATLRISGSCFNGEIKSGVKNAVKVWYRYKEEGGSYSAWTAATPTLSGNAYSANVNVAASLNYQNNYTFQARVQDDLELAYGKYVTSVEVTANAKPVFDWGKSDFNFNVPVTTNHNDVGFTHVHSNSGNGISFGVGSGGTNRGVWDKQYSKWLMYTNDTNTFIADANNTYTVGKNNVLWSGKYYMTAGQTANLSQPISKQLTGIILVFSRYDVASGEALNEHFSYEFVPKQMIALHEGKGSIFNLSTSNGSYSGSKYLYISDSSIAGHDNNSATGTGVNGVKYDNNRFVLRYVIGV